MNENCLHISCKGEQAILRQIDPNEFRPGWWYMFCPRCGMRGPAADNQQDARVLWAAIWATRPAPAADTEGLRDWQWIEAKIKEWDGGGSGSAYVVLAHIKSVIMARDAALRREEGK